jgi:hypothetical protein
MSDESAPAVEAEQATFYCTNQPSNSTDPAFDFIPEATGFQGPTHAWRQRWSEVTAPPSFLCHHCKQILSASRILLYPPTSHKKTDHEIFPHYESFNLLRDSALRGCHLCSLAWLSQSSSMPTVGREEQRPPLTQILGQRGVHVHAYDQSKFWESEEPYFTLRWDFGYCSGYPSNDLRVYQVLRLTPKARGKFGDEQLNQHMIPRSKSTGSDDSFLLASWWLHSCLQNHEECGRFWPLARDIPARLLHVGPDANSIIRICDVIAHMPEQTPQYLTVSHCWGNSRKLHLTEATLTSLKCAITTNMLSRTVNDAIIITRRLGFQYLWIDSLCIIQDSLTDWETESQKMAGIYGNSRCTIAALGSENDDGGCFRDRPAIFGPSLKLPETGRGLQICHPQSHYFAREYKSSGPTAAPLHRRAWVVQERALSPRTLYYGSTGILWECREADASDTDPMGLPRNPRESECVNKRVLDKLLKPLTGPVSEQQFHASWATLVERYTECVLTVKKDRRHAIQGFIDPVERKSGLTSVAGLWKEFLHTELLWATPGNACSKRVPQMPTWSWISTDGPVRPFIILGRCIRTSSPLSASGLGRPRLSIIQPTIEMQMVICLQYLQ